MDRVVAGRAARLRARFTDLDGEPENPADPVKVTVTRDDGTVLVDNADATDLSAEAVGTVGYDLTGAQTAELDLLRAVWSGTVGGQAQSITTYAEIAGDQLFEIAAARADATLTDPTKYSTRQIAEARAIAETVLEDACNIAFVPRYLREQATPIGWGSVRLSRRNVRAVRGITIDGTALTADELAAVTIDGLRTLRGLPRYGRVYDVAYEHGLDAPPAPAPRIALRLAKRYLIKTPVDERASTMTSENGTITLVTPGVRGMLFDIPEANAFVQQFGYADISLA